jgi:hypothetical protein
VYNRLTDFSRSPNRSMQALRMAYLADAVVLTPHPQTHALFADKRNLVALGDHAVAAASIGVADDERALAGEQHSAYRGSHTTQRRGFLAQPSAVVLQAGQPVSAAGRRTVVTS